MNHNGMTVGRWLAGLIFPERCAACDTLLPTSLTARTVCGSCDAALPRVADPACPFCGAAVKRCTCHRRRRHFDLLMAPFYYEPPVPSLIDRFKRDGYPYAVSFLAQEMAGLAAMRMAALEIEPDGIVPVPMTVADRRRRGFDQTALLAGAVSERLAVPVLAALQKVQQNKPQKSLSAIERSGNVLGVYDLCGDADVTGKRLLLIDDLATTGSTLHECAKMLKLYGAAAVYALTAAITVQDGARDG